MRFKRNLLKEKTGEGMRWEKAQKSEGEEKTQRRKREARKEVREGRRVGRKGGREGSREREKWKSTFCIIQLHNSTKSLYLNVCYDESTSTF